MLIDPDSECTLFQFVCLVLLVIVWELLRDTLIPVDAVYALFLCFTLKEAVVLFSSPDVLSAVLI